jgi:thiamine-monophosphate kinase
MARVSEIGEFPLIARLARHVPPYGPDVLEGIGDDVAVLRLGEGRLLLLTCDIQVAGVHFLPEMITPYQLGRKTAAINLSDIGSAGGYPRHFLISLGLPPDTEVEYLEAVYDGVREECAPLGVDVVGGNISSLDTLTIDAFLMGEVREERLLQRRGARPGDLVLVTGALGASRAGLELVLHPQLRSQLPALAVEDSLAAHLTPRARVRQGQTIAEAGGATTMIDVSDGLAADLGHICDASGVGVRINAKVLPVAEATRTVAAAARADPLAWALGGGEDYELCFTADPERVDRLVAAVQEATATPVSVIGEILPGEAGRWLRLADGAEVPLAPSGWDHFRHREA